MAQLKGSTTVGGYSPITKKTLMSILKILDGHDSGLDADLLDGLHASDFSRSTHTHSYLPLSGGTLSGKLTVNNHIEITGSGNNITLPNNYGIAGRQTDSVAKYMLWMGTNNVIQIGHENGNQVNIDCTSPTIRGGHKIYHQGFKPTPADIGARPSNWVPSWNDVNGKPTTFAPIIGNASNQAAAGNHVHNSLSLGGNTYIAAPKDGRLRTMTPVTGYLKITLPQSWTNTMMMFTVDILDYKFGCSATYTISGYNYNGGSGTWSNNPTAYSIGHATDKSKRNLTVRFGHDGKKCAIYIGNVDTVWQYPQITIKDITLGYSGYELEKWNQGWGIDFTTTLGTITYEITNPFIGNHTHHTLTRGSYLTGGNFNGTSAQTWAVDATSANTASKIVARDANGNFTAGTVYAALSGNATSATKLQTQRTINGTNFDGTGNITTSHWGTARNIQIGNTTKSVNGSGNVTWSISEIGARPSNWVPSWNDVNGKPSTFTPASHSHNDLYYTESEMNTKLNEKLNLNGSGAMTGRLALSAAGMTFPVSGGNWISGKTTTNVINVTGNASGTYYPILKYTSIGGHVANIGTIDNRIGFFGYKKDTTVNSTDSEAYLDIFTGIFKSRFFEGDGSKLTNVNATQLSGRSMNEGIVANTVVSRDTYSDIHARLFKCNYMNQSTISGAIAYRVNNTSDTHIRFCSDTNAIRKWIGAAASSHGTHVEYSGNGTANTVSRSDHTHRYVADVNGVVSGSLSVHGGGGIKLGKYMQIHDDNLDLNIIVKETVGMRITSQGDILLTGIDRVATRSNRINNLYTHHINDVRVGTLAGEYDRYIPIVDGDSVMEIGEYIDMHGKTSLNDYDCRIQCSTDGYLYINPKQLRVYTDANIMPKHSDKFWLGTTSPNHRWVGLIAKTPTINTSDRNGKKDIVPLTDISKTKSTRAINKDYYDFIKNRFSPTYFSYKLPNVETERMVDADCLKNVGFIAQDYDLRTDKVAREFIFKSSAGDYMYNTMSYVTTGMIALKEAINELEYSKDRISTLEEKIDRLESIIGKNIK